MGFSNVFCLDKTSLSEQGEYGGLKLPLFHGHGSLQACGGYTQVQDTSRLMAQPH